jgi:hypothetical protein
MDNLEVYQMSFDYSVSSLRNELYVYENDKLLFLLQGEEIDVDFTEMSNDEIHSLIKNIL